MKIAICTPVHGDPKFLFMRSLAALLLNNEGLDLQFLTRQGAVVAYQRNRLVEQALAADYVLWLDADQTFPPGTLRRLLAWNKPFIGCNYVRRDDPSGPTAAKRNAGGKMELVWTTAALGTANVPQEVDQIGMGVCLVAREVFEAVGSPCFSGEAEDYEFCAKAREAGFSIYLDHHLSWEIGHVGEQVFTHTHAILDQARFKMAHKM